MVHQYDHRWATFENGKFRDVTVAEKQDPAFLALPQYWVPANETNQRIGGDRSWLLGWRLRTGTTNERTFILSPHLWGGAGNSLQQFLPPAAESRLTGAATAVVNSFACDYATRQKLGGNNLNFFVVKQLPILEPSSLAGHLPFIERLLVELCYTAWDMAPFASGHGWQGPPFRWDTERRDLIRAEIDALMFRLYGINRSDVNYVMDTFEGLRKRDIRRWGEYRTKRLVLERYDAMAEAERSSQPYWTALGPPPADPSVAHDWATRPEWSPIAPTDKTPLQLN